MIDVQFLQYACVQPIIITLSIIAIGLFFRVLLEVILPLPSFSSFVAIIKDMPYRIYYRYFFDRAAAIQQFDENWKKYGTLFPDDIPSWMKEYKAAIHRAKTKQELEWLLENPQVFYNIEKSTWEKPKRDEELVDFEFEDKAKNDD